MAASNPDMGSVDLVDQAASKKFYSAPGLWPQTFAKEP